MSLKIDWYTALSSDSSESSISLSEIFYSPHPFRAAWVNYSYIALTPSTLKFVMLH